MNPYPDELESIETESEMARLLSSMPLRRPSENLDDRISATCRGPTIRWQMLALSGMAAAIVIALGAAAWLKHADPRPAVQIVKSDRRPASKVTIAPATKATAGPQPIRFIRTLTGDTSDGVVALIDGKPFQYVRRRSIQEVVRVDPNGIAQISYRQPREQVMLVRVKAF